MDTGPLYHGISPASGRVTYRGRTVNRATRIAALASSGQVGTGPGGSGKRRGGEGLAAQALLLIDGPPPQQLPSAGQQAGGFMLTHSSRRVASSYA